jgi:signal transduction histidine kinase/CheY-like chemotaxis protein
MLKISQIVKLFPAYISISFDGFITSAGPYFDRYSDEIRPCARFFDVFVCQTHWGIEAFSRVPELGDPVRLQYRKSDALLQGLVLPLADGYLLAVNLIPTAEAIVNGQLQIDDFGLGDPLASGMMSIIMQQASLDDARKSAQALAVEQQRTSALLDRVSRTAGYVAHDFNNFLSIIELNCDLLLQDRVVDARLIPKLQMIKETAQRTSETTYSLMTLAKLKYDSRSLIGIDELVATNVNFLRTVAGPNIELVIDLNAEGWNVDVAKGALLNSLVNLVINSRDSIGESGRIVVSTQVRGEGAIIAGPVGAVRPAQYVCIALSDTGSGMTEEVARQAFEPLFSTKVRGNGMGLASVREFCQEMGGDASLWTLPNIGTTITLQLPAVSNGALALSQHVPVAMDDCGAIEDSKGLTAVESALTHSVLVVEDEPYAREALKETLENLGLYVVVAGSGSEAIAQLKRERYDFLLADVMMPGMSGIDLARWVEKRGLIRQIVLMSGQLPASEALGSSWQFIRKPLNEQRIRDIFCKVT